ncbi:hypothetical protein F5Y04DRAFT_20838 [Hypomontagnella monticulosa]|nr:hypothetical protein F5Y04DRAFT_20838 [Hypomontagnella monticulosa]
MPSVTPFELPTLSPSKKRRRDDNLDEVQVPLYGGPESSFKSIPTNRDTGFRTAPYNESSHLLSAINNNERLIFPSSARGAASLLNVPRKVIPLPVSKRFRLLNESSSEHTHPHAHLRSSHSSHQQLSHLSHAHPEYSTPPASPPHTRSTRPPASLSPCHICHRKPTKKSDLDSFADCMGCGARACYVCLRACQGWLPVSAVSEEDETKDQDQDQDLCSSFTMEDIDDQDPDLDHKPKGKEGDGGGPDEGWIGRGHRAMVCSRCCVERGVEGDVVCLGCLAGMEGA